MVRGLSELQSELKRLGKEAETGVKRITEASGRTIELQAKQAAPVDTGKLRQSISYEPIENGLGAMVTANVPYAPFIEFGTGGKVEIPEGFDDLASQFKGAGRRQVNLPARPYLIPAFRAEADQFEKKLDGLLRQITS